jgi:hypothetical protein
MLCVSQSLRTFEVRAHWWSTCCSAVGHNEKRGKRHRETHENEACAANSVGHDLSSPWVRRAVVSVTQG